MRVVRRARIWGSSPLTRGKRRADRGGGGQGRLIPAHAGKTTRIRDEAGSSRAHPRSRGENAANSRQSSLVAGSSPLTRGKQALRLALGGDRGLIPAHAGKTHGLAGSGGLIGAHPRSRGENFGERDVPFAACGSSPLTRGKHVQEIALAPVLGLIPAHAGKTSSVQAAAPPMRAHPRSRGENQGDRIFDRSDNGSSPLTRGKPFLDLLADGDGGLIPAHAGKTRSSYSPTLSFRAHPRSRGENRRRSAWLGTPERLIPAHAGKTSRVGRTASRRRAHPRSRGENVMRPLSLCPAGGSSPLTRGKRGSSRGCWPTTGLIPAHAGKTAGSRTRAGAWRAHPRSRGENSSSRRCRSSSKGSSPLTRGKLAHHVQQDRQRGLIPAHAGKTVWEAKPGDETQGSSPLTRGKLREVSQLHERSGLIPAHAGKTSGAVQVPVSAGAHPRSRGENSCRPGPSRNRGGSSPLTRGKLAGTGALTEDLVAHPRSRGENVWMPVHTVWMPGSSPLTRGKLSGARLSNSAYWLIPAHAGKTLRSRSVIRSGTGSSPLTRGKLNFRQGQISALGLIPAHAGKTVQVGLNVMCATAHPRSRGENRYTATYQVTAKGSSPLTRGKQLLEIGEWVAHGLIPAHAGKTPVQGTASR